MTKRIEFSDSEKVWIILIYSKNFESFRKHLFLENLQRLQYGMEWMSALGTPKIWENYSIFQHLGGYG